MALQGDDGFCKGGTETADTGKGYKRSKVYSWVGAALTPQTKWGGLIGRNA